MKRVTVLLPLLFVFLVAGCVTAGPKPTAVVAVPDDVRQFSNGMQFVLKGEASDIMRSIEAIHLQRWGINDPNSPEAEKLTYPLYVQADGSEHDHVITPIEAKEFKVQYQRDFDIHTQRVSFPPH